MRLIDADALKKAVEDFPNCYNGWSDTYDKSFIIGEIEEQPSIDIVRCKECKYEKRCTTNVHFLADNGLDVIPVRFCSYGERREP